MTYKTKPVGDIPEWFALANDNCRISARDAVQMFGFSSSKGAISAASSGSFPKPDSDGLAVTKTTFGVKNRIPENRVFWKKSTLLAEWNRRKALQESAHNHIVEIT